MNLQEAWQLASRETNIHRARKNMLYTFGSTRLPYVCISPATQSESNVTVRRGEVTADRPKITLPGQEQISFEGFDIDLPEGEKTDGMLPVFLARRIEMPNAKYVNKADSVTTESHSVEEAVDREMNRLEQQNDIRTAVIQAPESVWQLSILMYVGSQIVRSAPGNITEHMEHLRLQHGHE